MLRVKYIKNIKILIKTIITMFFSIFDPDLPKDGPHISGEERPYNPGDVLSLNCSSGKSHPASTLHWFINGVQVNDK